MKFKLRFELDFEVVNGAGNLAEITCSRDYLNSDNSVDSRTIRFTDQVPYPDRKSILSALDLALSRMGMMPK